MVRYRVLPIAIVLLSFAVAASAGDWKEIPVGYNMSAMPAAAPASDANAPVIMAAAQPEPTLWKEVPVGYNMPQAAAPAKNAHHGAGPDRDHRWEIEVHGGGMFSTNPTGGTTFLTPTGAAFTTTSFGTSRQESSFLYGDGAQLVNGFIVAASLASPPIAPLDGNFNQ